MNIRFKTDGLPFKLQIKLSSIILLSFLIIQLTETAYTQQSWIQVSNIATLKLLSSDDGRIYAGTRDFGLYYTTDLGESWIKTGMPDQTVSNVGITNNGYIFAGENGIWCSTDNGISFSKVSTAYCRSIYIDKYDEVLVGSHYSGLLKSSDYGQTWQTLLPATWEHFGDIIQTSDSVYLNGYYNAFPAPGGPNFTYNSQRSTDLGFSWQTIFNGKELHAFTKNNQGEVFAIHNSTIYKSTDDGISWQLLNHNAKSLNPNSSDYLFASYNFEISFSSDRGLTWSYIPDNGLSSWVDDLICYHDTLIFVATSEGIFKRDQKVISLTENELPSLEFSLNQNYPNPFNPITRIKYQLPITTFVTLKIFDILGIEYATLVNEEKKSGSYEVTFNASKLSSGCYYYQMRSKNFSKTMKMVVTK